MISSDYTEAFACGVADWSGFWGDPWFSGTLMVVTYGLAALTVARVARRLDGAERAAWGLAAFLMAFQMLNTPLDLHGLMWATGRCLAHLQGWHAERHAFQRDLLVGMAGFLCLCAVVAVILLRRHPLSNGLLVLGLALSLGMTLVKGINYHHLEVLYQAPVGPLRIPELAELAGIVCVLLAVRLRRMPQRVA